MTTTDATEPPRASKPEQPTNDGKKKPSYRLKPKKKPDYMRNWVYEATDENKHHVVLSNISKSKYVDLSKDQLIMKGCQGYRLCLATHGAHEGTWYYEVELLAPHKPAMTPKETAWRIGWADHELPGEVYDANVGYSSHSFGLRSVDGALVHKGVRAAYGRGFGEGDVIGCLIHLPPTDIEIPADEEQVYAPNLNSSFKEKGERPAAPPDTFEDVPRDLVTEDGARMEFFINGEALGKAPLQPHSARYYPALSAYDFGRCKVMFQREAMRFTEGLPEGWKAINELHSIRAAHEAALAEKERLEKEAQEAKEKEEATLKEEGVGEAEDGEGQGKRARET